MAISSCTIGRIRHVNVAGTQQGIYLAVLLLALDISFTILHICSTTVVAFSSLTRFNLEEQRYFLPLASRLRHLIPHLMVILQTLQHYIYLLSLLDSLDFEHHRYYRFPFQYSYSDVFCRLFSFVKSAW